MFRGLLLGLFCWVGLLGGAGAPVQTNQVVAFIGGAQMVAAAEAGYLEALLAIRDQGKGPRYRDFSWEGDTVFTRPRPVNFPSLTNLLARAGTTVAVLQFGQMESLAGLAGLEGFEDAYEALFKTVREVVPQVVLLTPTPFAPMGPLDAVTAESRNLSLALYVAAIHRMGVQHDVLVINVFENFRPREGKLPASAAAIEDTTDGVQLNDRGHRHFAQRVAAYDFHKPTAIPAFPNIWMDPPWSESIRQAVVAKNRLWFRYWRPTNWAFLAGDRTEQPSSRDHRDRTIRWFPKEMEEYFPLLVAADEEIAKRAEAASKAEATR